MSKRTEQRLAALLVAVVIGCVPALVHFGRTMGALDESAEVAFRGLLGLVVLALLGIARLAPARRMRGVVAALSLLCAALSVTAYTNLGSFHHPRFVHYWEQFHYQLGSKYFPELGYDGLYVASLSAQVQSAPRRLIQPQLRDLRNNRVRPWRELLPQMREVRKRFDAERWDAFVADHEVFLRDVPVSYLAAMRRDHGYNPTPAWTAMARLFNAHLPLTRSSLTWLGMLDVALLALLLVTILRTYGADRALLCLVLLGFGYAGSFKWIGGAFLRLDWLAALGVGVCMLRRERPVVAGALFGYATAVRVFPAVFLFGSAVLAAAQLVRGERPRFALRLGVGFVAALVLAAAFGALAGRGPGAWSEFASRMETYRVTAARNSVGLESVVLYGGEILARAVAGSRSDGSWNLQREDVRRRRAERRLALAAVQATLLLLLAFAVWRAPPDEAAVLSMVALYVLTPAAGYYWILLLLAPIARRGAALGALLVLDVAMHGFHLLEPDNLVRYGVLSWGLLLLFLAWLAPEALRTLRKARTDPPRARFPTGSGSR